MTDRDKELVETVRGIAKVCQCKEECWPKPCPYFQCRKAMERYDARNDR
jgi:hypothetical protein